MRDWFWAFRCHSCGAVGATCKGVMREANLGWRCALQGDFKFAARLHSVKKNFVDRCEYMEKYSKKERRSFVMLHKIRRESL